MADRTPRVLRSPLRWWRRGAALAVAAVVLAVVAWTWVIPSVADCAPGVHRQNGECVGVTDGSFVFTRALAPVEDLIHRQNAWVDGTPALHVSVVYLIPITVTRADSLTADGVRHQLEGAYAAQLEANHPSKPDQPENDEGQRPLIRVLLANMGSLGSQWPTAVQEIEQRRAAPDNVVAVAGLGHSLDTTRQAIGQLSRDQIPMVGAVITADDFSNISGLFRVAPTNTREAQAGMAFAKQHLMPKRALLVEDVNKADRYSRTLSDAFKAAAQDLDVTAPEQFSSALPGADNIFRQMTADICDERPNLVYFAGRSREMQYFLLALRDRPCREVRLDVLTGDDGSSLDAASLIGNGVLRSGVAVYFTALAHPDDWEAHPSTASATFKGLFDRLFREESLGDGDAVMAYDAVTTAVVAIRETAGQAASRPPQPAEVIQRFFVLKGVNAIAGASGTISIDANGEAAGKTVVILQLDQVVGVRYVGR